MTGKKRKLNTRGNQNDRAYVVPDSVILGARDRNMVMNTADDSEVR
jgi:hypothetical protein